ncbi:MAG: hypothetical protein IPH28_10555 [Cytophagaceae bacterium]|nr:hypothetical protein [Cytophagaceae bacterium]
MDFQIEIFETNIETPADSERVIKFLKGIFPETEFNIDLWDPEYILRVKSSNIFCRDIEKQLNSLGFYCKCLP